ncbi:MAG: UDP-3-O-(3-hydroxymyristoyl)glucosamine N-acyltransferase [Elusimicrobiota bacterium]|jgi:UDP-3-O-[3-hydroxymyristoyl] glucosamine N-acyltransferase|nr:UDP-3-O-(3-hydroxymyristoyl)glucosamine N-acyltransferase [Elusimicrobiota bacterium]
MLTAKYIAETFDGKIIGNETAAFSFFCSIKDVNQKENCLAYITDAKYYSFLPITMASIVIMPNENLDNPKIKKILSKIKTTLIMVNSPVSVFVSLLIDWDKNNSVKKIGISQKATISETTVFGKNVFIGDNVTIDDGANIGDNTQIYPNSFIGKDVKIGKNCLIYPNVSILYNTEIGDNAIIHSGVVIGSDGFGFLFNKDSHLKIPQVGSVKIGDNVEIGANTTVDRSTFGKTLIGDGTKIDNLVQIAHNVEIGKHCIICSQVGIAGSTIIGDFVTLAGQAGITGHITIGDGAIVAAQAGVTKNIKPKDMVSGYPAMPHKEANQLYVLTRKLPDIYETVKYLKNEIKDLKLKLKKQENK